MYYTCVLVGPIMQRGTYNDAVMFEMFRGLGNKISPLDTWTL